MVADQIIRRLNDHAAVVHSLAGGVSQEQARWKPAADAWSMLEVVHHLYDEERDDFRRRLDHVLHRSALPWPEIDPAGWVLQRRYNEQDFEQTVAGFLRERDRSIQWLKSLNAPDWQRSYAAPWGPITAGDLLASWVAHDLLHLRQLIELHWAHTVRQVEPFRVVYAGEW